MFYNSEKFLNLFLFEICIIRFTRFCHTCNNSTVLFFTSVEKMCEHANRFSDKCNYYVVGEGNINLYNTENLVDLNKKYSTITILSMLAIIPYPLMIFLKRNHAFYNTDRSFRSQCSNKIFLIKKDCCFKE